MISKETQADDIVAHSFFVYPNATNFVLCNQANNIFFIHILYLFRYLFVRISMAMGKKDMDDEITLL